MLARRVASCAVAVLCVCSCKGTKEAVAEAPQKKTPASARVTKGRYSVDTSDSKALRTLFDDAAACDDRLHCPPMDELDRIARTGDLPILKMAFEMMCDPHVRYFDRIGKAAANVAGAWGEGRAEKKTFDDAARKLYLDGIERVLTGPSPTFRPEMFALRVSFGLPGQEEFLIREAERPGCTNDELKAITVLIRPYLKDLSIVKKWIGSSDEDRIMEGLFLLGKMDHELPDVLKNEYAMLGALAKRPKVSGQVVQAVIQEARNHCEPDSIPFIKQFEHHPDPEVRAYAKESIADVKQRMGE
ncbi:MAG: hypothetical protein EXR72_19295 [Myxococcales bacterium]|nr:hypothetical protein [Myxococcales bacterium]